MKLSITTVPAMRLISAFNSWVKDFAEGDPYSITRERASPISENYAFFDTLVEIETAETFQN